jgi:hypothetical protein
MPFYRGYRVFVSFHSDDEIEWQTMAKRIRLTARKFLRLAPPSPPEPPDEYDALPAKVKRWIELVTFTNGKKGKK